MSDHGSKVKYMSEQLEALTIPGKPAWNTDLIPCDTDDPMLMPAAHLQARICELAGHLTAATCRFLLLVADFDARRAWAEEGVTSCAAWLSWKCQIAPGTAREHVRVARALTALPVIRGEFAAARLSYAKVRALTRIATQGTEADLVEMAMPMTAGQLERFARAHRNLTRDQDEQLRALRKLTWRFGDDGAFSFSGHLPPETGAVILQALRAALNDLEHPCDDDGDGKTRGQRLKDKDADDGVNWGQKNPPQQQAAVPAENLADALAEICAAYLRGKITSADNADIYQVIIHASAQTITKDPGTGDDGAGSDAEPGTDRAEAGADDAEPSTADDTTGASGARAPGVPAETRGTQHVVIDPELPDLVHEPGTRLWHPAAPGRAHVEDGQAVCPGTVRLIGCNATLSTMLHDASGNVLAVGRRTRKPSAALRRAVRERDGYRCRYPGCESRRTDAHHIQYWANGGKTELANLCSLCPAHHRLVHDTGIIIAATTGGFAFYTASGTLIEASPPLPEPAGDISDQHSAAITPSTIIPPYSGERLDLHLAIWICVNNAKAKAARHQREQHTQAA